MRKRSGILGSPQLWYSTPTHPSTWEQVDTSQRRLWLNTAYEGQLDERPEPVQQPRRKVRRKSRREGTLAQSLLSPGCPSQERTEWPPATAQGILGT